MRAAQSGVGPKWDRLLACHAEIDRLEAYPTDFSIDRWDAPLFHLPCAPLCLCKPKYYTKS